MRTDDPLPRAVALLVPPVLPTVLLAVLLSMLLTVLLTACSPGAGPAASGAAAPGTAPPVPGAATSGPRDPRDPRFSTTDVAWLQLSEAMRTRALSVLALVPGRSSDRALTALAARLARTQEAERGELRALLGQVRALGDNPHAQHDMPGMTTAARLRVLAALRGAVFDRGVAEALRAHLRQSVLISQGEQNAGGDAATRRLAAAVERDATAGLAELAGIVPAA